MLLFFCFNFESKVFFPNSNKLTHKIITHKRFDTQRTWKNQKLLSQFNDFKPKQRKLSYLFKSLLWAYVFVLLFLVIIGIGEMDKKQQEKEMIKEQQLKDLENIGRKLHQQKLMDNIVKDVEQQLTRSQLKFIPKKKEYTFEDHKNLEQLLKGFENKKTIRQLKLKLYREVDEDNPTGSLTNFLENASIQYFGFNPSMIEKRLSQAKFIVPLIQSILSMKTEQIIQQIIIFRLNQLFYNDQKPQNEQKEKQR